MFTAMTAVGLSMTQPVVEDVTARPVTIATATFLQAVFIPAAGIAAVYLTGPPSAVLVSILLISACPGGGISNLYVLYARANTALSVVMTLAGIIFAILTLPITLAIMDRVGFDVLNNTLTPISLSAKLVGVIVVPVVIGMAIRKYVPEIAMQWEVRFRNASAFMILTILIAIIWIDHKLIASMLFSTAAAAAIFLCFALLLGFAFGRLLYSSDGDRFAVMTEFSVRKRKIPSFTSGMLRYCSSKWSPPAARAIPKYRRTLYIA